MTDRTRDSVGAGLCSGPDGLQGDCALQPSVCINENESFLSSREIQNFPNAHGGSCLSGSTVRELLIGSCSNGSGRGISYCASDASLCNSPSDWNPPSNEGSVRCTVATDNSGTSSALTQYGLCGDVDCAWSNESCRETFQRSDKCTCDKVRTGGCVDATGHVFCAVSASACTGGDTIQWMSPQQLSASTNVDCFLCREFDPDAPLSGLPSVSMNRSNENKNAALVGGIVGGVIIVLFVISAVLIILSKRRKASAGTMALDKHELQMEVEVTNSERHTSTADDAVSELGQDDFGKNT
ncbi:hypothetical protein IV203_023759 [Nitzschia inconspicua]|uniref:Uncharacterized protein n=1 Tax=Nitzschia inconspicua TaxID=303405 RepID=A0A9K3KBP6_9STRA|nr:hypothetical protein IV203_023759 [Nitzschia inconspicua]